MAIFMQIPDVPGEAKAKGFEELIECQQLGHGVSQAATSTQSGSLGDANCTHQDFSISKLVEASSPQLLEHCCKATDFAEIKITVTKTVQGTQIPYFVVTLSKCILSSVSYSGDAEGAPMETLSINYGKVNWEYTIVDKTGTQGGTTEGAWDLEQQAVPS